MIFVNGGMLQLEGRKEVVIAETVIILNSVYEKLVEDHGEEKAMELFAEIGRMAVMSEDEIAKGMQ